MWEFRDSRFLLRTVGPFDDLVLFMNSLLNGDIMNRSRLREDVNDKKTTTYVRPTAALISPTLSNREDILERKGNVMNDVSHRLCLAKLPSTTDVSQGSGLIAFE